MLSAAAGAGAELRPAGSSSDRDVPHRAGGADASAEQTGKPAAQGDWPWGTCAGIVASGLAEATLSLMAKAVNY